MTISLATVHSNVYWIYKQLVTGTHSIQKTFSIHSNHTAYPVSRS